jgi:small conductance mechanosensitive channel
MRNDPAFGKDMLEPIEIMGLDRFADSAQVVRARLKTRPIQQWRIGREFNRRLKKAFDAAGIEMPFPHRTLYWGMPKQGSQPPVHVAMEDQAPLGKEGRVPPACG